MFPVVWSICSQIVLAVRFLVGVDMYILNRDILLMCGTLSS